MDKKMSRWHKECAYAYFFERIQGIGARSIDKLYNRYGSYESAYRYGSEAKDILRSGQREDLVRHKKMWDIEEEYRKLLLNKIWCVPKMLTGYPEKLKEIDLPPSALFVKGKLPDPDKPAAALIGARNCSPYGEYAAKQLGKALAGQGIQVISGMARGIDSIGQEAALMAGGASFGVLGCGVDICYPEENRSLYMRLSQKGERNGLISEMNPGTLPLAGFFPMRNRIISGLSDAVIVLEAREKSGTFITVSKALDQGKDVYALPGRLQDPLSLGCNRLIGQGAFVVHDIEDTVKQILERFYLLGKTSKGKAAYDIMSVSEPEQAEPVQSQRQEVVFREMSDALLEHGDSLQERLLNSLDIQFVTLEEIMRDLGAEGEISAVLAALSTLECEGKVEATGTFYRKRME